MSVNPLSTKQMLLCDTKVFHQFIKTETCYMGQKITKTQTNMDHDIVFTVVVLCH